MAMTTKYRPVCSSVGRKSVSIKGTITMSTMAIQTDVSVISTDIALQLSQSVIPPVPMLFSIDLDVSRILHRHKPASRSQLPIPY